MIATVSKVVGSVSAGKWGFMASIKSLEHGLKSKGYEAEDQQSASRARAKLIKALKGDGFKVLMVQ